MQGYQVSHLQDGRLSTQKENMLKRYSNQDFISITLLIIIIIIIIIIIVFY